MKYKLYDSFQDKTDTHLTTTISRTTWVSRHQKG